jgi:hypothetical protein
MKADPFIEYRKSSALFTAVTADDGLTLTLRAIDVAAFHGIAHAVIEIANRIGWRVERLHRDGVNIARLTVAPAR